MAKSNSSDSFDINHVLILGDKAVGKTSLVNTFLQNPWLDKYTPTLNGQYSTKSLAVGNKSVILNIYDANGDNAKLDSLMLKNRFIQMKTSVFPCPAAVIVVFDTKCFPSLLSAETIVKNFKKVYKILPSNAPIVLVGNKVDLNEQRCVTVEDGKKVAGILNADYIEVSAKTGQRVDFAFEMLAKSYLQKNATDHAARSKKERKQLDEKAREEAKIHHDMLQKYPVSGRINNKDLLESFTHLSDKEREDAIINKWQTLSCKHHNED